VSNVFNYKVNMLAALSTHRDFWVIVC